MKALRVIVTPFFVSAQFFLLPLWRACDAQQLVDSQRVGRHVRRAGTG
jgi:hypothetical protein